MWSGIKHRPMVVLKVLSVGLVVLILSGIVYEKIGERQDRKRYLQIGRSVDIGGRTLNIYCSGEGGPSVVFDTYGHMAGYSWSAVQREVGKFTRACWYDRAAYGWSDPAPMPRTFQSVASDLHALLHAAAVSPPHVLVGAGDSASHIRVYHGMYPGEVAGVVMVSANGVDDPHAEIPDSEKGGWAIRFGSLAPRVRGAACIIYPILGQVGGIWRQGSKPSSVRQLIRHEVQTPHLVRPGRLRSLPPMDRYPAPASQPLPERQSLFSIESVHQISSHFPALPMEQRQDLPISVTHSSLAISRMRIRNAVRGSLWLR